MSNTNKDIDAEKFKDMVIDMTRKERLELIKKADIAYYNDDAPIMSDAEYDKLRNEYIAEFGNEELNYVPGNTTSEFRPFIHTEPVSSLRKVKENDTVKVLAAVEKLWPVVLEPKIDGLTVVAYPNEDGSYNYVTRGNGDQGDILPNFISKYEGIQKKNSKYPIRGEVFLGQADFEFINNVLESEGEQLLANPRNAAAGILRNKERSRWLDRLQYLTYDVLEVDWTEDEKIAYIKKHTPFNTVKVCQFDTAQETADNIKNVYNDYLHKGKIPVDGVVIKTNQENSLQRYGRTGHHPNNAVAWKVEQTGVITVLKDIEWQVGRKYITPVAIMEPVSIQGSVVEKASVANISIINRLGLTKNAKIRMIKANEIIPQIIAVEEDMGGDNFTVPEVCPCCGTEVKFDNDRMYCPNEACKEKLAQNLSYIASKKVLNIKGLSIETCRKIINYLLEKNPLAENASSFNAVADCLGLTKDDILNLSGFKDKSAEKLAESIIQAGKEVSTEKFVAATAMTGIGLMAGGILAKKYGSVEEIIKNVTRAEAFEELQQLDGIGSETAKALSSDEFVSRLKILSKYLTNKAQEIKENDDENKESLSFVLTGKMEQPRSYYEEIINKAGHKVVGSVSKNTAYLVIADVNSTSSKAKKAREVGTKLISPDELVAMFSN